MIVFPVLLLFLSVPLLTQTKRTLVIGIGKQKNESWTKINRDKDVSYVQQILLNAGYMDVRTLVNEQATKVAIVAAIKKLADKCKVGDIVYVQFSGHGRLVTDENGDEADGWDEAWIPYDAYLKYGKKDKGEKHLIDDEINTLLTAIRNKIGDSGKLLVVVDACHSSDYSRGDDIDETVRGVKDEFIIPEKRRGTARKAPEQWLTLSVCKDYQLNQEMKNHKAGKLTYALYFLSEKGSITIEAVQLFMQRNRGRFAQIPLQTGETSKYKISDFIR